LEITLSNELNALKKKILVKYSLHFDKRKSVNYLFILQRRSWEAPRESMDYPGSLNSLLVSFLQ